MTHNPAAVRGRTGGSTPARPRGVGLRAALLVGFCLLIVFWVGAIIDLASRIQDANRQLGTITEDFIRTEDALQTIRANVLLAAIDWRDAFLDLDATRAELYRSQLRSHQRASSQLLARLRSANDVGIDHESLDALEREVSAYWAGVMPLVEMAPLRQAVDVRRVLTERVIPKRAQAITIVHQVQQMNRTRFQQQQRDTADLYARAQARVAATVGLTALLSIGVGGLVFVHVSRLERELRAELAANADITADLHRLSARIVRVQEDERQIIARELHDEVGQALTAVKMQLSVVRRSSSQDQCVRIDEARGVVDAALQSARNLSRLLHPPMLDDIGLAAAVDWHLRSFSDRTGIVTSFEHEGSDRRVAPDVETCLFRVVQEATTNVARHASAHQCRVYLQRLPTSVVLTVEDDGCGFDPQAIREESDGLGLLGIRERVSGFRGVLHVDSGVGRGTRVTVEVPLEASPPPQSESGTPEGSA